MVRGVCLGLFEAMLAFLLACSVAAFSLADQRRGAEDDQGLNKAILEMLHINRVSVSHHVKPHPYMRRIYQHLDSLEAQDFGRSDGMLVQSFRSVDRKNLKQFILLLIQLLHRFCLQFDIILVSNYERSC